MDNIGDWIEHLDKPMVLLGVVFIVFAGVIKVFKPEKLSGKATERLMNRALILIFILGVLIIGFTFVDALLKGNVSSQTVKGNKGTVIQSGGDIYHNQGQGTLSTHSKGQQAPAGAINQLVEDNEGDVYQGRGDVHVQEDK